MRKITQIAAWAFPSGPVNPPVVGCYALCDDGTVWSTETPQEKWEQLPPIPQPTTSETTP